MKQKPSFCQYELFARLNHLCEHPHSQLLQLLPKGLLLQKLKMSQNDERQFRNISLAGCSMGWQLRWTTMLLELSYQTVWDWAWGQNMFPLLNDIAHATINRKDIYSLLNNWAIALTRGRDWGCISVSSFPFTSCHAGLSWLDPIEENLGGEWVYRLFLCDSVWVMCSLLLVTLTTLGSNPLLGRRPAPKTSWRLHKRRECKWGKMLRFGLSCILNSFWWDSTCRRLPAVICPQLYGTFMRGYSPVMLRESHNSGSSMCIDFIMLVVSRRTVIRLLR